MMNQLQGKGEDKGKSDHELLMNLVAFSEQPGVRLGLAPKGKGKGMCDTTNSFGSKPNLERCRQQLQRGGEQQGGNGCGRGVG